MSKPVKELLKKEYIKRFAGASSVAVIGYSGVNSPTTRMIRGRLRKKQIRMTVVKNSVARQALKEMGADAAAQIIDGPCAVAYGATPDEIVTVVRELLEVGKDVPNLIVKAAVMDGEVFPADRVKQLSEFPTRNEAIARVIGCSLSPGRKLLGCVMAPGGKLVSILKTIEEKTGKQDAEAPAA